MYPFKQKVFCPVYKEEKETYCYIIQQSVPIKLESLGCEDCNASPECKECMRSTLLAAKKKLAALIDSKFPLDQN